MSTIIFTLIKAQDLHMSLKNYEESDYGLNLDMLYHLILFTCVISQGSGLVEESNHLRPIYLNIHITLFNNVNGWKKPSGSYI